MYISKLAWTGN